MLDDDRVDPETGLKADFVQRAPIGRVGNGHGQSVAPLVQRDYLVGRNQFTVDGVGWNVCFVENRQVKQGVAEGVGDEAGQIERRDFLAGDDLMLRRPRFVKTAPGRYHGRAGLKMRAVTTLRSCVCRISTAIPVNLILTPASGIS